MSVMISVRSLVRFRIVSSFHSLNCSSRLLVKNNRVCLFSSVRFSCQGTLDMLEFSLFVVRVRLPSIFTDRSLLSFSS